MKITTVRYRRLKSDRYEYGHRAIEAEAQVEEGEAPEAALAGLKSWIEAELSHEEVVAKAERDIASLTGKVEHLKAEQDGLKGEISASVEVLRKFDKLAQLAADNGMDMEAAALLDAQDRIPF